MGSSMGHEEALTLTRNDELDHDNDDDEYSPLTTPAFNFYSEKMDIDREFVINDDDWAKTLQKITTTKRFKKRKHRMNN